MVSSKIKIDTDSNIDYEVISNFGKILNFLWIGTASIVPYRLSNFLLIKSKKGETIKNYSTKYQALEEMYMFNNQLLKLGKASLLDYIWLNQKNPKALRNRLKLFKKLLKIEIENANRDTVKILSLGSGSARGVIEVIKEYRDESRKTLFAVLVDKDPYAIEYSRNLASTEKIEESIKYYLNKIDESIDITKKEDPQIIEMVGILDYLKDKKVINILNNIFDVLKSGSRLITCNINCNFEEKFNRKTVKWKMIHKKKEDFFELLQKTKFRDNIRIIG